MIADRRLPRSIGNGTFDGVGACCADGLSIDHLAPNRPSSRRITCSKLVRALLMKK
jgi:hypothetical protein